MFGGEQVDRAPWHGMCCVRSEVSSATSPTVPDPCIAGLWGAVAQNPGDMPGGLCGRLQTRGVIAVGPRLSMLQLKVGSQAMFVALRTVA